MKNDALFIGWNRPTSGRNMDAVELFGSFISFLESQKKGGHIHPYEPTTLSAHGGDLSGLMIVRGGVADQCPRAIPTEKRCTPLGGSSTYRPRAGSTIASPSRTKRRPSSRASSDAARPAIPARSRGRRQRARRGP